jgi:hypothetical protein
MPLPEDVAFNQRVHAALLPVAERYVRESGRPDQVYAAPFDPDEPLLDYTQTHFAAQPWPAPLTELAGRFVSNKIVGIPKQVLDGVLVPAFAERAEEIIEHRLERPLVQLADHAPNRLPVATQFAGNLALVDHVRGATPGSRLRGLIHRSHGIGTVGYRSLGVRPVPRGPGVLIGKFGQAVTHTHYSVPTTEQYWELDLTDEDRGRLNGNLAMNLIVAMQQLPEPLPSENPGVALLQDPIDAYMLGRTGKVRPANLHPECVINAVATKELPQDDGRVVIPRAGSGTGRLIDALKADVIPVYTSFTIDKRDKVVDGYCEVGDIIPNQGDGVEVVQTYHTRLAAFRSEREDREVIYADAA